jgi:hypothetical protein
VKKAGLKKAGQIYLIPSEKVEKSGTDLFNSIVH